MPYKMDNENPKWWDKNNNKRLDLDDVLIGIREAFHWIFSWRGAMVCCSGFTVFAASLNIAAWLKVFPVAQLGSLTPVAGVISWGILQTFELMPILDDLTLGASLSALIRLQRKPLELPVINKEEPLNIKRMKRYRNRERNQELLGEFIRYACYGLELSVLVVGGQLLHSVGINWGAVLLAIVGIIGVELGIRKTNECGEKLLNQQEREFLQSLRQTTNVSVK